MRQFFVIAFCSLLIWGCKSTQPAVAEPETLDIETLPPPPPPVPEVVQLPTDTLIWYRRTACFGQCPSFDFHVRRNGMAFYEGRNFVDLIGEYKGQANQDDVQKVLDLSVELHYKDLDEVYDNQFISDLPSVQTIIEGKRVVNRYQGPNLTPLYNAIDSMIVHIDWSPDKEE